MVSVNFSFDLNPRAGLTFVQEPLQVLEDSAEVRQTAHQLLVVHELHQVIRTGSGLLPPLHPPHHDPPNYTDPDRSGLHGISMNPDPLQTRRRLESRTLGSESGFNAPAASALPGSPPSAPRRTALCVGQQRL